MSSYNERMAKADKTRKEGKALLVKAEAEAALTRAKARKAEALAREQEIKNEGAEELLRRLKERGIDLAAEVKDGQLHVAVIKEPSLALPASTERSPKKPKRTVKKKRGGIKKIPE